ncbi:MAG TPA: ATP synthase subunit I [Acidimicrobiales bacterium]|jgi:hypothetical protein
MTEPPRTDPDAASATDAPEVQIAGDLARRALPLSPALLLPSFVFWGMDGLLSSAFGLAVVVGNFLAAAALSARAARISLRVLMVSVLLGYLGRLAIVFIAILAVRDFSWVEMTALGLTIVIAHLGLLIIEARHVSASLAFPGLRPGAARAKGV